MKSKAILGQDINEEQLSFSVEQMEKIEKMRRDRSVDNYYPSRNSSKPSTYVSNDRLEVGMPVTVVEGDHTMIGFVISVNKTERPVRYDINTPGGLLKNVYCGNVRFRKINDYTGVVIPEELKKLTTQHLLAKLKRSRIHENGDDDNYWTGPTYYCFQLKAELATREHIATKAERKAMINNKKRNKREEKYKEKMKKAKY